MIPSNVIETLARVQTFARVRNVSWFLVGGLVRDQLLGRPFTNRNVDLAVPTGAITLARALASALGGAFVPLDEAAGSARVVISEGSQRLDMDISDFRGPSLEADLGRRDFTVNAIAIALADWLRNPAHPGPLIDPCNGRHALSRKELAACFPGTFDEDPVRILRAFRFAAQLEFAFADSLETMMARAVEGLVRVSGERLRDELVAICATDRAGWAMTSLNAIGALDVLFPELVPGRAMDQGGFHHLDVLGHQLETVHQGDRILAACAEFSGPLRGPLNAYCAEELVERRSRKSLIKLGGLLHDAGKPANRQVHDDGEIWFIGHEHTGAELALTAAQRLRFSNRETQMISQLVRHHLRPGFLSREPQLTRRAIYRFYKDLGDDGPACLLTWWCDRMATRGPLSRVDQLDQQRARLEELLSPYFFKVEEIVKPPRLVDGHQLMAEFHLTPGPAVGELLAAIEEAQAEGQVHSAEEALALAKARLTQSPQNPP
ncbi:MAG: HD domain-containing protein [Candidatus Omnitrophica bacterium]|nr:HD domain-containing protein [Candidatus Omnitrophota bacterium]